MEVNEKQSFVFFRNWVEKIESAQKSMLNFCDRLSDNLDDSSIEYSRLLICAGDLSKALAIFHAFLFVQKDRFCDLLSDSDFEELGL